MATDCIYLDHHATTPLDRRVLEAMMPYLEEKFGNAASAHPFGWEAAEAVEQARAEVARAIGADAKEIVFTSGATESNNLAIRGVAELARRKGNHLISVVTEHRAVLDPLKKLQRRGYRVSLLPVIEQPDPRAGQILPEQVADAIDGETLLVSVMLANNEIGTLQPIAQVGRICKQHGVLFHCDAAQALGKVPIDVNHLQADLMSFSAHKLYGPKGVGALYVRRRNPHVRLEPLLDGGGHERGLRSGTLNVPGIVGFGAAVRICLEEMDEETLRIGRLRDRLFGGLVEQIDGVELNGPALDRHQLRLAGNLNVRFAGVDAESLLLSAQRIAASTGSACSSAQPEPSHVLRAIGLDAQQVRSSVRFGLGRLNTTDQIDRAVAILADAVRRLRSMGRAGA